jgi:hypothetical protein
MKDLPPRYDETGTVRPSLKVDDVYVLDVSSGLYQPKSYVRERQRKNKKSSWPSLLYKIGTLALLSGTVYFTMRQWKETAKSADAAKDAAIAAKQSADTAEHSFEMEKRRAEDVEQAAISESSGQFYVFKNIYYIDLANTGKVTARNISSDLEISLTTLPRNKKLRSLGNFNIIAPQLEKEKDLRRTLDLGLTATEWNNISDTKEAITESGYVRYENGFGRIIESQVCNVWIYYKTPEDKLNPVQGRGSICDRLSDLLASVPKRP